MEAPDKEQATLWDCGGLLSSEAVKQRVVVSLGPMEWDLSSSGNAGVRGLVYSVKEHPNNTTRLGEALGCGLVATSKGAGGWLEPASANGCWFGCASVCGGNLVGGWFEYPPESGGKWLVGERAGCLGGCGI